MVICTNKEVFPLDESLYKKYKHVKLPNELVQMYTDIISSDEATRKVFLHIGQQTTSEEDFGITISQLVERVKLTRRVRKGKSFVIENTNIERKHVERILNSLFMMGLCYYRFIAPTKVINLTFRGKQVTAEFLNRIEKAKKIKGDENNAQ